MSGRCGVGKPPAWSARAAKGRAAHSLLWHELSCGLQACRPRPHSNPNPEPHHLTHHRTTHAPPAPPERPFLPARTQPPLPPRPTRGHPPGHGGAQQLCQARAAVRLARLQGPCHRSAPGRGAAVRLGTQEVQQRLQVGVAAGGSGGGGGACAAGGAAARQTGTYGRRAGFAQRCTAGCRAGAGAPCPRTAAVHGTSIQLVVTTAQSHVMCHTPWTCVHCAPGRSHACMHTAPWPHPPGPKPCPAPHLS